MISAAAAVRRVFRKREVDSIAAARLNTLLGLLGVLIIITTVLLGSVMMGGLAPIMARGVPVRLIVGVATGIAVAALTLALLLVIVVMANKRRSLRGLAWPSVHCAFAVLFVVLLHYWNLLGLRLG
jgi:hypothetical protein